MYFLFQENPRRLRHPQKRGPNSTESKYTTNIPTRYLTNHNKTTAHQMIWLWLWLSLVRNLAATWARRARPRRFAHMGSICPIVLCEPLLIIVSVRIVLISVILIVFFMMSVVSEYYVFSQDGIFFCFCIDYRPSLN